MAKIYYEKDADLNVLKGKKVADASYILGLRMLEMPV